MKIVSKSSFTLFELLIVILIISIIYGIFIEKINSKEYYLSQVGLKEIDKFFKDLEFNETAKIVCSNECEKCWLYVDGKRVKKVKSFFKEKPTVYDFDIHGILSQIQFLPLFKGLNPQEVCFEYVKYPNHSNSSYIVEYKKKFYIFFSYFHPPKVTESISSAQDVFDPSQWIPTDPSEYNF